MKLPVAWFLIIILGCGLKNAKHPPKTQKLDSGSDTSCVENIADYRKLATVYADSKHWKEVSFNDSIHHYPEFKILDTVSEPQSPFEFDSVNYKGRSISLSHFITVYESFEGEMHKSVIDVGNVSTCKVYKSEKGDTLIVNIGFSSGFSGWGFNIYVKGEMFVTMPWYFDDIVDWNEIAERNCPTHQKLILNKTNFQPGDSVLGFVEFKSIFFNEYDNVSRHSVKGYFRAKVTNKPF